MAMWTRVVQRWLRQAGLIGLVGCALGPCLGWAQGALPVVPNADLEEGEAGPAGWQAGHGEDGTGSWRWDSATVHQGSRAFRLRKDNAEGFSSLVSELITVEPGREYEVTGWAFLHRRTNAGVYFMLSQYGPDSDAMQLPNAFGASQARHAPGVWTPIRARVTVRPPNTRIRIHALVAFAPCEVTWDDIHLAPAGPAPAARYEAPTAETVPPPDEVRRVLAGRPRAQARLEVREGRPRFVVDGRLTPPCFYVSPFHTPDLAQIGDFRRAGVRVYLVPLILGRGVYGDKGPWLKADTFDFAEVDALLWRVLTVDPEGYILFYLACDPYRDWGSEHPDDVTQDQNGLKAVVGMHPKRWGGTPDAGERFGPSLVSETLRADTATALRALAAYAARSEPGKAVIGYHVAGSNDGQWFHWTRLDPQDLHLADYSPAAQRSFRAWLRRLYRDDAAALQRAWHRPGVTFEDAAVPAGDRLWGKGFFTDPATDQDIRDYNRFYSEGVAETVLHLCRTLREATGGSALLGTYYEDITCNSANHIALQTLLESSDIDFLAGPAAYGIRLPGNCGAVRSVFGSTLLHGKLYLTEQDWRSWHSGSRDLAYDASVGRAESAEAHNAMVRRESGMMLAFGLGTWWYDVSGGWFRDDQIMAGIAEARAAFEQDLRCGGLPRADAAVVVSEEGSHGLLPQAAGQVRYHGIVNQVNQLNTSGVPYRMLLLSDFGRLPIPDHRLYIFVNCYALNEAQLAAIDGLRGDGRVLVFLHAPGALGAADPAAAIERVTGIKVRALAGGVRLGAAALAVDDPLLAGTEGVLAATAGAGWPAFEVIDPAATALARYPQSPAVSVACRRFADHQVVFAGCFTLADQFLHNLAKAAGAWCVAAPGDAVYASQYTATIHALHALDGGRKHLTLASPSRVVDMTSGQVVAEQAATLDLTMALGETRWFRLTPLRP